jgi:hypothetical protein
MAAELEQRTGYGSEVSWSGKLRKIRTPSVITK